ILLLLSIFPADTWKNFKTTCESGWLPFHCNCYRLNSEKRTWQEARKSCVRSEGDLLSVHHLAELEFVLTSVKQGESELWIGLNDIKLQMNFAWSDGSPVNFTYWHPYEPNNFHSSQEDCVTLWGEVSTDLDKASCLGEEEVEDDLGCQKVSEKHHRGIQWEEGQSLNCCRVSAAATRGGGCTRVWGMCV
uniref:C-type lectin domain-containing protein n=1 Tax=Callorhinchus milii TaxID=7868 RepID=A0A4W3HYS7_CALMI